MSLRRAVPGRSKTFDQLLAEHRQAKEALLRQKKSLESQTSAVILTPSTQVIRVYYIFNGRILAYVNWGEHIKYIS